jgi:hypothetical protein
MELTLKVALGICFSNGLGVSPIGLKKCLTTNCNDGGGAATGSVIEFEMRRAPVRTVQ